MCANGRGTRTPFAWNMWCFTRRKEHTRWQLEERCVLDNTQLELALRSDHRSAVQWKMFVRSGPIGPVTEADLDGVSALRAAAFLDDVLNMHAG